RSCLRCVRGHRPRSGRSTHAGKPRDFFIDDCRHFAFHRFVKLAVASICLVALSLTGCPSRRPGAVAQNVDPALCGPYPNNYKEVVWNWMQGALVDADSAKIEWLGYNSPLRRRESFPTAKSDLIMTSHI